MVMRVRVIQDRVRVQPSRSCDQGEAVTCMEEDPDPNPDPDPDPDPDPNV